MCITGIKKISSEVKKKNNEQLVLIWVTPHGVLNRLKVEDYRHIKYEIFELLIIQSKHDYDVLTLISDSKSDQFLSLHAESFTSKICL